VHLIALCCYLERGYHPHDTTGAVLKALERASDFEWLEPPIDPGSVTILDVYRAATVEAETKAVEAWVASVWSAWSAHHRTLRLWADRALLAPKARS
jgi:hypothetical protein